MPCVSKNIAGRDFDIAEGDRDYYLERMYSAFGNLAPRDIASRAAKMVCDEGRGIGETGLGVYLDFSAAIARLGEAKVRLAARLEEELGEAARYAGTSAFPRYSA